MISSISTSYYNNAFVFVPVENKKSNYNKLYITDIENLIIREFSTIDEPFLEYYYQLSPDCKTIIAVNYDRDYLRLYNLEGYIIYNKKKLIKSAIRLNYLYSKSDTVYISNVKDTGYLVKASTGEILEQFKDSINYFDKDHLNRGYALHEKKKSIDVLEHGIKLFEINKPKGFLPIRAAFFNDYIVISNFRYQLFIYSLKTQQRILEFSPLENGNTLDIGIPNKDEIIFLTNPVEYQGQSVLTKYDKEFNLIAKKEIGFMELGKFAYYDKYFISEDKKIYNTKTLEVVKIWN